MKKKLIKEAARLQHLAGIITELREPLTARQQTPSIPDSPDWAGLQIGDIVTLSGDNSEGIPEGSWEVIGWDPEAPELGVNIRHQETGQDEWVNPGYITNTGDWDGGHVYGSGPNPTGIGVGRFKKKLEESPAALEGAMQQLESILRNLRKNVLANKDIPDVGKKGIAAAITEALAKLQVIDEEITGLDSGGSSYDVMDNDGF